MLVKETCCVQQCVKILKKVRLEVYFHGDNELFNAEVTWNVILVKGMSVSLHNYKIMSLLVYPLKMISL